MGGAPAPSPMGGASDVPPSNPPMGGGDPMGGGPDDGMGGDPSMGGGDPMGGDPSMGGGDPMGGGMPSDGDGQLNPNMDMGADPMGGDPSMDGGQGDDSTMSLFNQLSDEDKEAARGYIESMLDRSETHQDSEGGEMDTIDDQPPMGGEQQGPMMESFTFKKRDIKKINEALSIMEPEEKKTRKGFEKKMGKSVNKKSLFNSPKFD